MLPMHATSGSRAMRKKNMALTDTSPRWENVPYDDTHLYLFTVEGVWRERGMQVCYGDAQYVLG